MKEKRKSTKTKPKARSARRAGGKRRIVAKAAQLPRSREEALLRRLVSAPRRVPYRHLQIQDLLYSSGAELRSLAFSSGFNLGAEAYRYSDKGIGSLEHILENAGLGKVIYYPSEFRSTLTSYRIKARGMNLGTNVHVFEAGVISGYLSSYSGRQVTATEVSCVFNGSSACEFIARSGGGGAAVEGWIEFPKIIRALEAAVRAYEKRADDETYYALAIRPLLAEPMLGEAEKFLYLSGKMLARSRISSFDYLVERTAHLLGIEKARVAVGKDGQVTVSLTYGPLTSTNHFVNFSSALLSGIAKGAYGKNVRITRSLGSKGIYNVKMQVLGSARGQGRVR